MELLEEADRKILVALYASHLTDQKAGAAAVSEKTRAVGGVSARIEGLRKRGLVKEDCEEITQLGIESLKIVLAGGVFDIIHPGHIHTLSEAKKLGDVLVVAIATDKTAVKMKKRTPLHSQEQRKLLVGALEMVDAAVIGDEDDIFKTVGLIKPQIIALGYDQAHQEKAIIDGCKRISLGVTVARLQSPMPKVSSSAIEREYGDEIHGT